MSLNKIQELVSSLAHQLDDKKFLTPVLATKAQRLLQTYPQDRTLGAISVILEKMAANKTFIAKSELKDLYNKNYCRHSKFAELFQDELGIQAEVSPVTTYARVDDSHPIQYEADPILTNALKSALDKTLPFKPYSDISAKKALAQVSETLELWDLKPVNTKIAEGNDKFLVVQADYETPKGITSFYVPIEIFSNKVSEASMFMGNTAPQDLNYVNVRNYITKNAGVKLAIDGATVMEILVKSATTNREITDAELALIKLNSERRSQADVNQILGQKLDELPTPDVQDLKFDTFASFEETFDSPLGQAQAKFGKHVDNARNHLARELTGFGFRNPQISVTSSDDNGILYSIAVDGGKVAFTVPVKIDHNKLMKPTVLICNGSISPFSKQSIGDLRVSNQTDFKAAAVASPQFKLKPSDLIRNIRTAMEEGNLARAEDALNVLMASNDTKAYATGFQAYLDGLAKKEAAPKHSCKMQIKSANSTSVLCGHTGLPLHKVYQDKNGNCCPAYRKDMEETYEAASFMNAKIFG